ncbi:MAG: iron-containing alcohol dehydrogenase [Desulfosarcinaceae bacterium]|nr:iron-containing alcohol dehydrogenase [Desulfosarcinaceae bacterium]
MKRHLLRQLRKFILPEIVYGPGALQLAGQHARNFGASRVFLVTDPGVVQAGWTERAEASLETAGIDYVRYDGVTPNPKDHEVERGAEVCAAENCDLIVAVGGGSPMDAAKGIGLVVGNGGHVLDFEGVDVVPNPGPPLIFIPTTAGTSADVSQFAIITDTNRNVKIAIISKMVIPDIALVDPETTTTMPPELTAATGMDALCHAFEAYVSTNASPLTDMAALQAVGLIAAHLLQACKAPDEMTHRDPMMMASLMAGLAFSNASLGLVHAMAHSLGGALGLAHGECNARLLEAVVAFNYPAAETKYRRLAAAMGIGDTARDATALLSALTERIAALRRQLGIEQGLKAMGVAADDLSTLARNAHADPCLATNPRPATPREIESIYSAVLH